MVNMSYVKKMVLCKYIINKDGLGLRSLSVLSRLSLSNLTHL